MKQEILRVVKVTREDNFEKDEVTFKVTLKSRDDNMKLTLKMDEDEYEKFTSDYAIYPGAKLLFILKKFQRTMDEFVTNSSKEEKKDALEMQ